MSHYTYKFRGIYNASHLYLIFFDNYNLYSLSHTCNSRITRATYLYL